MFTKSVHCCKIIGLALIAWAILGMITYRPARAQSYTVTDLGVVPGLHRFTITRARDINAAGQVVGTSGSRAFLWQNGVMTDLGSLAPVPGGSTEALGINAAGQVVGGSATFGGGRAFLWQNGTMMDLGFATAYDINDIGQVVGLGAGAVLIENTGILWQNGTITNLGVLPHAGPGTQTVAFGINAVGQVVGSSASSPFLWQNGVMIDIGVLPRGATAYDINDIGQVVGAGVGGLAHAFLWQGGITDLGTLGGNFSEAYGINNSGQIVGISRIGPTSLTHAFLWQDGTMTDLNSLIPANSGWTLFEARAINDGGQIVGKGSPALGVFHAFLLTPEDRTELEITRRLLVDIDNIDLVSPFTTADEAEEYIRGIRDTGTVPPLDFGTMTLKVEVRNKGQVPAKNVSIRAIVDPVPLPFREAEWRPLLIDVIPEFKAEPPSYEIGSVPIGDLAPGEKQLIPIDVPRRFAGVNIQRNSFPFALTRRDRVFLRFVPVVTLEITATNADPVERSVLVVGTDLDPIIQLFKDGRDARSFFKDLT